MDELARSLKNLRKLRGEIEGLEISIRKARNLTASDVVKGSSDEFPYSKRHFRIEGVDQEKESVLQIRLRNKKKRLEREVMEAEKYLDALDNPEMRNILRLRYEQGLSWMEVARACDSTEYAVKAKDKRFFQKIGK